MDDRQFTVPQYIHDLTLLRMVERMWKKVLRWLFHLRDNNPLAMVVCFFSAKWAMMLLVDNGENIFNVWPKYN